MSPKALQKKHLCHHKWNTMARRKDINIYIYIYAFQKQTRYTQKNTNPFATHFSSHNQAFSANFIH